MFNLIVWSPFEDIFKEHSYEIDIVRFLEYTRDNIREQLSTLSKEAVNSLVSWPCLLMEEGRGEEKAYLALIEEIEACGSKLHVRIRRISTKPELTNDVLWKIRENLDIAQFEFGRHHWAVKERNLIGVLEETGFYFDPEIRDTFLGLPLPSPRHEVLFEAFATMSKWTANEIDDFVLEAGISSQHLNESNLNPRDRAGAIFEYIQKNPGSKTRDNSLLSSFFVTRTNVKGKR